MIDYFSCYRSLRSLGAVAPWGRFAPPSVASLPLSLSLLRCLLPSPASAGVGACPMRSLSLPFLASLARPPGSLRSPPPIILPYVLSHQLLFVVSPLSLVGVPLSGCFGLLRFASLYTSAPSPGVPLPWVAVFVSLPLALGLALAVLLGGSAVASLNTSHCPPGFAP